MNDGLLLGDVFVLLHHRGGLSCPTVISFGRLDISGGRCRVVNDWWSLVPIHFRGRGGGAGGFAVFAGNEQGWQGQMFTG